MMVDVLERSLPPPNPNNSLLTLPRFSSISMILWEPFLEFLESWRFLCVGTCVLRMRGIGREGGCFWSVYNFVMRIQDNWEMVGEDLKTVIREVKNHQRNLLYVMALWPQATGFIIWWRVSQIDLEVERRGLSTSKWGMGITCCTDTSCHLVLWPVFIWTMIFCDVIFMDPSPRKNMY